MGDQLATRHRPLATKGPARNDLDFCMPNCTPSWIASQSQNPRRRTATPVVSLRTLGRDSLLKDCPPSLFLPNMGHTWTPNCPTYFLPIPKRSAFTLIELLVVIAVIAVLMAVLLPVLGRVRKQAKAVVCQANLRQWGMALRVYAQDNEGQLPTSGGGTSGVWLLRGSFTGRDDPNSSGHALHHFSTRKLVLCPEAKQPGGSGGFFLSAPAPSDSERGSLRGGIFGNTGSTFGAWTITDPPPVLHGSYGYNSHVFGGVGPRGFGGKTIDLLSLKGGSAIPLLLDATHPWKGPRPDDRPASRPDSQGRTRGEPSTSTMASTFSRNRHNGHINALFLDWSVRKVGLKELWTLKWSRQFNTAGPWTMAGGVQPEDWPQWMRGFKDY